MEAMKAARAKRPTDRPAADAALEQLSTTQHAVPIGRQRANHGGLGADSAPDPPWFGHTTQVRPARRARTRRVCDNSAATLPHCPATERRQRKADDRP
jgi:hypothetical protein